MVVIKGKYLHYICVMFTILAKNSVLLIKSSSSLNLQFDSCKKVQDHYISIKCKTLRSIISMERPWRNAHFWLLIHQFYINICRENRINN